MQNHAAFFKIVHRDLICFLLPFVILIPKQDQVRLHCGQPPSPSFFFLITSAIPGNITHRHAVSKAACLPGACQQGRVAPRVPSFSSLHSFRFSLFGCLVSYPFQDISSAEKISVVKFHVSTQHETEKLSYSVVLRVIKLNELVFRNGNLLVKTVTVFSKLPSLVTLY